MPLPPRLAPRAVPLGRAPRPDHEAPPVRPARARRARRPASLLRRRRLRVVDGGAPRGVPSRYGGRPGNAEWAVCSPGATGSIRPALSSGAQVEPVAATPDAGAGGAGAEADSPAEALPSEAKIAGCFERRLPEGPSASRSTSPGSARPPTRWRERRGSTASWSSRGRRARRPRRCGSGRASAPTAWPRSPSAAPRAVPRPRPSCCPRAVAASRWRRSSPSSAPRRRRSRASSRAWPATGTRGAVRSLVVGVRPGLRRPPRAVHEAAFRSLVGARRVQ